MRFFLNAVISAFLFNIFLIDTRLRVQHGGAYPNYGFPGGFPGYAGFQNLAGQSGFGGYGGSFGGGFGGGQEGAAASASIGPGGVHQTAGVFPENPVRALNLYIYIYTFFKKN